MADPSTLALGDRSVPLVVRRNPRARRIILRIDDDADGVTLTLPSGTDLAEGLDLARLKADWIVARLDTLPARVPFADGARIPVLGETLRLSESIRKGEARLTELDAGTLAGVTSEDDAVVDAYVRDLLRDADGELAARLLGSEGDAQ